MLLKIAYLLNLAFDAGQPFAYFEVSAVNFLEMVGLVGVDLVGRSNIGGIGFGFSGIPKNI